MKKLFIAVTIFSLISCKKSGDTSNPTNEENLTPVHKVGENFGGGIIIRVDDESGLHGTIVAKEDQSTGCYWSGSKAGKPGVETPVSALINTNKINDYYSGQGVAAKLARDYRGGGFSDWALPTQFELTAIYKNRALLGSYHSQYWSCQEAHSLISSPRPWYISMYTGEFYYENNNGVTGVRAVRNY